MSSQIEPVQSPCVGNCCLDDHDICLGCFRELEEIKVWSSVDNNSSRDLILANARRREQEKMRERS